MPRLHPNTNHPSGRLSRDGYRLRTGEQRSLLILLTLCLTLTTAVALLGAGAALTDAADPPRPSRSAEANAQIVRDFYAAVNGAIRTGNADLLDTIVTPGFVWCRPCPAQSPTHAGLARYLSALHRTAPDARLVVESVVAGHDGMVTARVRPTGFPLVGEQAPWGPVDTLRLSGGFIAERRSDPADVALSEPLLGTRLDPLPPALTGVVLARLDFPLDSGVTGLLGAGPTLLVVEAGALELHIASGGRVVRAGGDETTAVSGMGLMAILHRGDAAIVPSGTRYALHQQGPEPAVALGATFRFVDHARDHRLPREIEREPFFPPEMTNPTSPPLPAVRHLAAGVVEAWPTGPVNIALGRAILGPGPGARIVPTAGEAILFAVESGTLGVGDRTIAASAEAMQPMEPVREFRNAGAGPLVLLALTIAPATE